MATEPRLEAQTDASTCRFVNHQPKASLEGAWGRWTREAFLTPGRARGRAEASAPGVGQTGAFGQIRLGACNPATPRCAECQANAFACDASYGNLSVGVCFSRQHRAVSHNVRPRGPDAFS